MQVQDIGEINSKQSEQRKLCIFAIFKYCVYINRYFKMVHWSLCLFSCLS